MKWFMCINGNSEHHKTMSKVAVISALKNTALVPHLIYAGECDDYSAWMMSKGVRVFYRILSYIEELRRCNKERRSIGSGAFLRTEIPCLTRVLEFKDKYILYTDCDVMFLNNPPEDIKPEYFACGPEFDKENKSHVNTGVMYLNLHSLYYTYEEFKKYIIDRIDKEIGYDQAMYNVFYKNMWDTLPATMNWKPYWGYNEGATVIHWHGPKPTHVYQMKTMTDPESFGALFSLWHDNIDPYDRYLKIWEDFLCSV